MQASASAFVYSRTPLRQKWPSAVEISIAHDRRKLLEKCEGAGLVSDASDRAKFLPMQEVVFAARAALESDGRRVSAGAYSLWPLAHHPHSA
jgi:hypothetical protein